MSLTKTEKLNKIMLLSRIVGVRSTEQSVGIKVGSFCPDIM